MNYGHFIAKIKNDNMQFFLNKFNNLFRGKSNIEIQFFNENPLSIRRIRYNQGGATCYCMKGQEKGKQKMENIWKPVVCSEQCKYRQATDKKPLCNEEGTLKFIIPSISTDRIWIMKITGQTSINRLNAYITLQKSLGQSLVGTYTLFLKQESQTNRVGKTFNNYILDIVKKEDFISNTISETQKVNELSTTTAQTVNTSAKETSISAKKEDTKKVELVPPKNSKEKTNNKKTSKNETTKKSIETPKEDISNYYCLLDTTTKTLIKDGKPVEYLIGNFVDHKDKPITAIINPKFADELSKCDLGTSVLLQLQNSGENMLAMDIKFVQKCFKNKVA